MYKTSDFYSAVVLKTVNVPLLTLERVNEKYVRFVFNSTDSKCREILNRHWNGELNIQSRLCIDTIKELKTRVFEKLEGD